MIPNEPYTLHLGDCLEYLRGLPDNCVDSVVTDPPYGISFMGKRWDYSVPGVEVWAECLRVLKPGGYLLSFGGTRTYHRLATRVEDAGFTLHPLMAWLFGSGFPKATRLGVEGLEGWRYGLQSLKPALEPICFAQKPFSEKTGSANVKRWGTGAVNIDGCRIPTDEDLQGGSGGLLSHVRDGKALPGVGTYEPSSLGRWPANLLHDGSPEVVALFPSEAGAAAPVKGTEASMASVGMVTGERARVAGAFHADTGSAARFFYCPKTTRRDRNEGCDNLAPKPLHWSSGEQNPGSFQSEGTDKTSPNNHPTVKPTDLMAYLLRLVTPIGGLALDPFMGSGSTGKAAIREGFRFIGCELDAAYMAIAKARIAHELAKREAALAVSAQPTQADLFGGVA